MITNMKKLFVGLYKNNNYIIKHVYISCCTVV